MACAICEIRRPRRYCPGVRGDICTQCCGTEREATVSCPLECPYLQEARQHERTPAVDPDQFPNRDIRVTDEFLREHEELLVFLARTLMQAALETSGAVDYDVRETLDALIRTYRTLQSGVYYETRPANLLAANLYGVVQNAVAEFRQQESVKRTRDAEILGMLVFLQRLELDRNNGRPRGRAFIDFLHGFFREAPAAQAPSLLIP